MPVLIGTSGWQYRHWRETFSPREVRQADWLAHSAARFATVEVNNAFCRLPEAATFARWARGTPDDFVFAVKASRFLTHVRRLREPEGLCGCWSAPAPSDPSSAVGGDVEQLRPSVPDIGQLGGGARRRLGAVDHRGRDAAALDRVDLVFINASSGDTTSIAPGSSASTTSRWPGRTSSGGAATGRPGLR